jgi:hypothetical protein
VGIVGRRARRRVLIAGAATGAAAYHAGKKHEQHNQQYEQPYDEPYDTGQPTQYAPAPPQYAPQPQSTGPDSADLNQIAKLAELHQSGALTDEEFAVAKAKLLS